ncbi:1-phosphofructokinase family hexose kinase [Glaciihabitans sp. INWT7]|uniref:1-phosphofructokinase family hexose kinase n=1 Tax=Glaciihabitans sp. INWT7 TaxID=2596912 RepID=UPI001C6406CA|nr:1-phosphofructokinase family hexose kinase [Glaciihabitans sp. INWT7]
MTLNPSLDRTVGVDHLERGAVLRTSAPTLEPGGKGVNLTRALSRNGIDSIAVLPVGGPEGAELSALLDAAGVATRLVPVNGRTRSNLTVSEPDGTVTKLNEPGTPLSAADFSVLATVLAGLVSARDWVVFSGSIPPGCSSDQLVALMTSVTDLGASLAVDTSGDALTASIAARPRVIKPNRAELAEAVGRELGSISDVIVAAEELRSRGVERVLVSLGADGAVLVGEHGATVGESTVLDHRSTVGAGDCFLAGFLSKFCADESDEESALVEALAWGAAAVGLPGTSVPGPGDIAYSNVHLVWQPDLDRPLVAT